MPWHYRDIRVKPCKTVAKILSHFFPRTRLSGLCRRQQNAREDAPGADAQPSGGEEGVVSLVGADAAEAYAVRAQSAVQELLSVTFGQVDVPLGSDK